MNLGIFGALSINEALDIVEPAEILALLLDINVVGNKDSEGLSDATLLEEALHEDLEVLVEAAKGRTGVDVGALLGGLGAVELGDVCVLVEEHVVDDDATVLGGGVNVESAGGLAGLLDDDGQVDGGGGFLVNVELVVDVFFGLLLLGGVLEVVGEVFVLEGGVFGVGVVVGDVGYGEADGDSGVTLVRVDLGHCVFGRVFCVWN